MPRRDGTGPMGAGSMTGRGLGLCTGGNALRLGACLGTGLGMGLGIGRRRGFGGGFTVNQTSSKTEKDLLHEQKTILQEQLEVIDKQLESL